MKDTHISYEKEIIIFVNIAFLVPFCASIFMKISYLHGGDISLFSLAQMHYPAAGAILAMMVTRKDSIMPRKYFICFLVLSFLWLISSLLSTFIPNIFCSAAGNILSIGGSILLWIMLMLEKSEVRKSWGLNYNTVKCKYPVKYVFWFAGFLMIRSILGAIWQGKLPDLIKIFTAPQFTINILIYFFIFFLSFTAYFGEEYGWRYFLQSLISEKFGKRKGCIILGVIWTFWHLPLYFSYSTPQEIIFNIVGQFVTCLSFAIFFGYVFIKTENIWIVSFLHAMNNSFSAIIGGLSDPTLDVSWKFIWFTLVVNGICLMPVIFSKSFQKKSI